jgi:hypothetical protein
MSAPSNDLFARSNLVPDQVVGQSDQLVGRSADLRRIFRALWPAKTATNLSLAADVTVRQAERIMAGEQGLSLAVFCRLLHGEHGLQILRAAMGDAAPQWWREFGLERQITEKKKRRLMIDRELNDLEQRLVR